MPAVATTCSQSSALPVAGAAEPGRAVSHSYWQRVGGMPLATAAAPLPHRATILIVGGGFAGLATALRIKELDASADVVLLEARTVGYGASGRNGGLMSPLAAPIWLTTALNNPAHARAINLLERKIAAAAEWARHIAPEAEVSAIDLALESQGPIVDAGLAHISRTLDAAGLAHDWPPRTSHRGPRSLVLRAHTVNPYRLATGLAAEARRRGVTIAEQAPVRSIDDGGTDGARVILVDGREIQVARVILSTNAYTPSLALARPPKARVVRNYMLATAPLGPELLACLTHAGGTSGGFVVELNTAYVFYRVHQGRLVFGGIEKLRQTEGGDLDVPAAVMRGLRKHLARSLKGSPLPDIVEAWGGRYHMTSTDLPIIGPAGESSAIVHNVGYGGTGVALTLSLAPLAAAMALGRPVEDQALAEIRDTMAGTRMPVAGALRFAAGVVGTWFAERRPRR